MAQLSYSGKPLRVRSDPDFTPTVCCVRCIALRGPNCARIWSVQVFFRDLCMLMWTSATAMHLHWAAFADPDSLYATTHASLFWSAVFWLGLTLGFRIANLLKLLSCNKLCIRIHYGSSFMLLMTSRSSPLYRWGRYRDPLTPSWATSSSHRSWAMPLGSGRVFPSIFSFSKYSVLHNLACALHGFFLCGCGPHCSLFIIEKIIFQPVAYETLGSWGQSLLLFL